MNLIEVLPTLRQAGFFAQYASLSDEGILEALFQRQIEEAAQWSDTYIPTAITDVAELVAQDSQKCLHLDLEADVCAENKVYTSLLQELSGISAGGFNPTHIEETWEGEEGPIKVHFNIDDKPVVFKPKYMDDWIDTNFFSLVEEKMAQSGRANFHVCAGTLKESWFGQDIYYIRLTPEEMQLLKDKLGWIF